MKTERPSNLLMKVMMALNSFFNDYEGDSKRVRLTITDVEAEMDAEKLTVSLKSTHPGLVIGRKGGVIDAIREYLRISLECDKVKILIFENHIPPYWMTRTEEDVYLDGIYGPGEVF